MAKTQYTIDGFAVRNVDERGSRWDLLIQIGLFCLMTTFAGLFGWAFHMWKAEENVCKGKSLQHDGPFDPTKHCLAWHEDGLYARPEGVCTDPCAAKHFANAPTFQADTFQADGPTRRRLDQTCNNLCNQLRPNCVSSCEHYKGATQSEFDDRCLSLYLFIYTEKQKFIAAGHSGSEPTYLTYCTYGPPSKLGDGSYQYGCEYGYQLLNCESTYPMTKSQLDNCYSQCAICNKDADSIRDCFKSCRLYQQSPTSLCNAIKGKASIASIIYSWNTECATLTSSGTDASTWSSAMHGCVASYVGHNCGSGVTAG